MGSDWLAEDDDVAEGGRFVSQLRFTHPGSGLVLGRAGVLAGSGSGERMQVWGPGLENLGSALRPLSCLLHSSCPHPGALALPGGGWARETSAREAHRLPAFTPLSLSYFPPGPSARAHRHPDQQAAR